MRKDALFLTFYRLLTWRAFYFVLPLLMWRKFRKKEDLDRIDERRGMSKIARPDGVLVWFHTASVGEALSAFGLAEILRAERSDITVLISSGTRSAAHILSQRKTAGIIHVYSPLDGQNWVRRFMDHWRPDLAIWLESEFWPNLILETWRRKCPMLLLNSRMSSKSSFLWNFARVSLRRLLGCFEYVFVQNTATYSYLEGLGLEKERLKVQPNLKAGNVPLPCPANEVSAFKNQLNGRPCWVGASTHAGEEAQIIDAHIKARKLIPDLCLILVPRHVERANGIHESLKRAGLVVARRSKAENPTSKTDVYLADTLGELGLWYCLAPVSLVGGSLIPEIGGHNPYEPAGLDCAIFYGPYVENFSEIYDRLKGAGGAVLVENSDQIAEQLKWFFEDAEQALTKNARLILEDEIQISEAFYKKLLRLIPGNAQ